MAIMGLLGFKSRTGFLSGLAVAQISEFSLIVIAMGGQLGHLSEDIVTIASSVGIITIAISVYLFANSEIIYRKIAPFLKIFERKHLYETKLAHHQKVKQYEIILLGQHRIGYSILKNVIRSKKKILVVDYNPTLIKRLMQKKIPCLYGDIADPDILHELEGYKPKIVISTIHLFNDNVMVTKMFRKFGKKVTVIVTANTIARALDLYEEGADYVIIPQILGGEKVSDMLKGTINSKTKLAKLRNHHIRSLMGAELPQ
jgi:voltage-gated potassium channel Kch